MHGRTWTVLVELLRPIGELVAIPQPSKPHKAFLSVLVRYRPWIILPHEVSFSFGMRKFIVLITDNKLPFPIFRKDLEKFVYTEASPASERPTPIFEQQQQLHGNLTHGTDKNGNVVLKEEANQQLLKKRPDALRLDARRSQDDDDITRWRPRMQPQEGRVDSAALETSASPHDGRLTRQVSTAPGISSSSQNEKLARPVSTAPGVHSSIPIELARPMSSAPGDIVRTSNMPVNSIADACTESFAPPANSSVSTLLSNGREMVCMAQGSVPSLVSVVDPPLVEDVRRQDGSGIESSIGLRSEVVGIQSNTN